MGAHTGRDRSKVLLRISELIRENADELVRLESLDVGKPVGLCRPVDVETAAEQYAYCAALAQTMDGSVRSTPFPAHAYTVREPVGVVAAITPFNFPLVLSSTKIAPAWRPGTRSSTNPPPTPRSALCSWPSCSSTREFPRASSTS